MAHYVFSLLSIRFQGEPLHYNGTPSLRRENMYLTETLILIQTQDLEVYKVIHINCFVIFSTQNIFL